MKRIYALASVVMLLSLMIVGVAQGQNNKTGNMNEAKGQATGQEANREPARAMQATSGCWNDPTNDPHPEPYPRADLTRWCASVDGGTVTLRHRNATMTNPNNDPNWVNGITGLLWDIDLNGDNDGEFEVFFINYDGLIVDVVRASDEQSVCRGTASYDGSDYIARFPLSCIGSPASFNVDAFMMYDSQWDDPYAPVYSDIANYYGGPIQTASTGGGGGGTVNPAPSTDRSTKRLAGSDRYRTAVEISQYQFPDGANEVYIARGDNYPDALAGGSLTRGPVLLVPQCGDVPSSVLQEVRRLNPNRVVALGGSAAVCDRVLNQVANA